MARGVSRLLIVVGVTLIFLLSSSVFLPVRAQSPPPSAPTSACPTLKLPTPICHVFVIFLENQERSWVVKHAPYQLSILKNFSSASRFYSLEHYSFPAYVAATTGTVTNYIRPMNVRNVVDLLHAHAPTLSWGAYMEGMPVACDQSPSTQYRVAHNPFVEFKDITHNMSYCRAHDQNFTAWDTAVQSGVVPNYGFFGPNVNDSCWLLGVTVCDQWLKGWLPPLLKQPFYNSSVFFITYDESIGTDLQGHNRTKGGGHLYTAAVSPYSCPGFQSFYNYSHYNILTTTEWLLGLGHTGRNDSWQTERPMRDLFCFPNGTNGTNGTGGHAWGGIAHSTPLSVFSPATARPKSLSEFRGPSARGTSVPWA